MELTIQGKQRVSYAYIQNKIPFIEKVVLENESENNYTDLTLQIFAESAFFEPYQIGIQELAAHDAVVIEPAIILNIAFMKELIENELVDVVVEVRQQSEIIIRKTLQVDLLAFTSWPGIGEIPEIVAAFILPNEPYINEIVSKAKAFLHKIDPQLSFLGYQSGSKKDVLAQVEAVYQALVAEGIGYVSPPPSFEQRGQKVFLPSQIDQNKLATCFDSSLLFAACLERIGLYPLLLFYRGHANCGVWLNEYCSPEPISDDVTYLLKRLSKDLQDIVLIETTAFTNEHANFSFALRHGDDNMQQFELLVDVYRARIGGIRPINAKLTHQNNNNLVSESDFQLEEQDFSETEDFAEELQETAENQGRLVTWQKKLLDFSLRNPLLNYNVMRRGVPFISDAPELIEDLLQLGKQITIEPVPQELLRGSLSSRQDLYALMRQEIKQKRLRAALPLEDLQKRLVRLYREARLSLEETGANTLYLAIGFLEWREKPRSPRSMLAPILLVPVDLIRISAKSGYKLRKRDEEIVVNISLIEYMKLHFQLDFTFLYNELPQDDAGIDVRSVLQKVQRKIADIEGWLMNPAASLGIFSFSKFIMWHDLKNNGEMLTENKVIQSLITGQKNWTSQGQLAPVDLEKDSQMLLYTPLSADSTQLSAIQLAGDATESFVLHGPPGSGKSQTITNMIAQALASDKTVLFVAAKMSALEVVKKRLNQIGLGAFALEAYSNKAQKKHIFEQIQESFAVKSVSAEFDWAGEVQKYNQAKSELNEVVLALHAAKPGEASVYAFINDYLSYANQPVLTLTHWEALRSLSAADFSELANFVQQVALQAATVQPLADNPWLTTGEELYSLAFKQQISGTLISEKKQLSDFQASLAAWPLVAELGIQTFGQLQQLLDIMQGDPEQTQKLALTLLLNPELTEHLAETLELLVSGEERQASYMEFLAKVDGAVFQLDGAALKQALLTAKSAWALPRILKLRKVYQQIKIYQKTALSPAESEVLIQKMVDDQAFKNQLKQAVGIQALLGAVPDIYQQDWPLARRQLTELRQRQTAIQKLALALQRPFEQIVETLQKYGQTAAEENRFNPIQQQLTTLLEMHQQQQNILKVAEPLENQPIVALEALLTQRLERLDQLKESMQLLNLMRQKQAPLEKELIALILADQLPLEEGVIRLKKTYAAAKIEAEIQQHPALQNFSSVQFEHKIELFKQLDADYGSLSRLEVYRKLAEKIPTFEDVGLNNSEAGILKKAIRSNGRGLSIRSLFSRTSSILTRLKPVMLMSPLSVAQYLGPDFPKFDLVIFDEASQLPTSEAVGAMARGKEVVVVGDPNQLPPTNFFQVKEDEEADFDSADLESILDDVLAIGLPEKHLKWHYRSEHESLIAFSNNHYYQNQLVTFPSLDNQNSRVSFRNVKGVYQRGTSRDNPLEAQAVVAEIMARLRESLKTGDYDSIGVVTFSQAQQTTILDLIDEHLKDEPALEKYFSEKVAEPVFVKNLENVQGDERDVILFSVGYGPDEKHKFTMAFGPLNKAGGWRRLNVAISRAKKEIILFASFEPEEIDTARTRAAGPRDLKDFMKYARLGTEPRRLNTGQKVLVRSEILRELTEKVQAAGYVVENNLGASRFRLPIAIKRPAEKAFFAYLWLDDEAYFENATARDREVLKPSMMATLGWQQIRVWSLNWWENPEKEWQRVLGELTACAGNATGTIEKPGLQTTVHLEDYLETEKRPEKGVPPFQLPVLENEAADTDFYAFTSLPLIKAQIKTAVSEMAPLSVTQLYKIIATSWGMQQVGNKIREICDHALKSADVYVVKDAVNRFVWPTQTSYEDFAEYFDHQIFRRNPTDISEKEYWFVTTMLLGNYGKITETDLIREVQRTFGYVRLNKILTEVLKKIYRKQVKQGKLIVSQDLIRLAPVE